MTTQAIKPGPKRIAKSTGKPDQRQHDNKKTITQTIYGIIILYNTSLASLV